MSLGTRLTKIQQHTHEHSHVDSGFWYSLLHRGLHEVSSEEKVSAQGVMGRTK
jgi:hypothetical protein